MEDGAKEECKEPAFLDKAGWLKKDTGRLLASFKDRYIHVEKTVVVVYENEELKNCLERLDLENYDRCHELKSPFKKKHRLILIRSHKSANKVHDVKFQAQTAEEKEVWIKAFSDAINRAKNKALDEVKTDQTSHLEHITRTRPKGNHNRRPPTRIHMKEVAILSSDGTMRLDLDLEDAVLLNGTNYENVDSTQTSDEAIMGKMSSINTNKFTENLVGPSPEEAKTEEDISCKKKKIKPPMPPTKDAKPSAASMEELNKKDDPLLNKDPEKSMSVSEETKPCVSSIEEPTEKPGADEISERSPNFRKKTDLPPSPPIKPKYGRSSLEEASYPKSNNQPPTPPSKGKKPIIQILEPEQAVHRTTDEIKDPTSVHIDEPDSSGAQEQDSEEESDKTVSIVISPALPPKKMQVKNTQPAMQPRIEVQDPSGILPTATYTDMDFAREQEVLIKSEVTSEIVFVNEPVPDNLSQSTALSHSHKDIKEGEEKSVDSGQHSDDDSVSSGSKDTLAAVTTMMRGSHVVLDVLELGEHDIQIFDHTKDKQALIKPQVGTEAFLCQGSVLNPPIKPSVKARSVSFGDLLSDSSVQVMQNNSAGKTAIPSDDVVKLKMEVSLQMEKTNELLHRLSMFHKKGVKEDVSENLLAEAMEKLREADLVLRESKKQNPAKMLINRKSW